MCKALERAEKKGNKKEIEGELKDMPAQEEDNDWNMVAKGSKKGSKNRKNQQKAQGGAENTQESREES